MKVLSGREAITANDKSTGYTIQDFWAWNSSDLLNNTLRGAYAEFLIATALDIDIKQSRIDWDAYDLNYTDTRGVKKRIEVKCCAYVQSWSQEGKLSEIRFNIAPTREWSVDKWYGKEALRHSDIYVFCLLTCKDKEKANPLEMSQWDFYVVRTKELDAKCGAQKIITLKPLTNLEHIKCCYGELKEVIDNI